MKKIVILGFAIVSAVLLEAQPVGIYSVDTVKFSVACNQTASKTITLSNTGNDTLTISTQLSQDSTVLDFFAPFEGTTLDGFINTNPSLYNAVLSTAGASAQGVKHMQFTGMGSANDGLRARFPRSRPTEISYYIKRGIYENFNSFVEIGGVDSSGNFVRIFNSLFRYNDLRLYHQTGHYAMSTSTSTWYKIELRNINFVTQTYSVYVNGSLVVNNTGFVYPSQDLSQIEVFGMFQTDFRLDHVLIDDNAKTYSLSHFPPIDTIPNGDSTTITYTADAYNMAPGVHYFNYIIQSNAAGLNGKVIPIKLTVIAKPQIGISSACTDFGDVYIGQTRVDSVKIENTGCSDLIIYGFATGSGAFNTNSVADTLHAAHSGYFLNAFSPSTMGNQVDTLLVYTNIDTLKFCLLGEGVSVPVANVSNNQAINITLGSCNDSIVIPYHVANNGFGSLKYIFKSRNDTIKILAFTVGVGAANNSNLISALNSEMSRPFTISTFSGSTGAALAIALVGKHILLLPPTTSAQYSYYFNMGPTIQSFVMAGGKLIAYGSGYGGNMRNLGVFIGGTGAGFDLSGVSIPKNPLFVNNPLLQVPIGTSFTTADKTYYESFNNIGKRQLLLRPASLNDDVLTEIELGDGKGCYIGFHFNTSNTLAKKLSANLFTNYGFAGALPPYISIAQESGILPGNDSMIVPIVFHYNGQANGVYTDTILLMSNDTINPVIKIPVTLTIHDVPEIASDKNCVHFGAIGSQNPTTDTVKLYNSGCLPLIISGIQFFNAQFSSTANTFTIAPGDSVFLPITITPTASGAINSYLEISNNDTLFTICLTANIGISPNSYFNYSVANNCNGLVNFVDASTNSPTNWTWHFGDGNVSYAQNPTHTYAKPGTYQAMLIASNTSGVDTNIQQVAMLDVFYAEFAEPALVQANVPAQFYDSCQVATQWQWFFGDGGNSTVQNPVHTYINKGQYFVTLVASNANCSKTVNRMIVVQSGVGLDEDEFSKSIKIYPVPASTLVQINWQAEIEFETAVIFDALGNQISVLKVENDNFQLDVKTFSEGIYFVQLNTNEGKSALKKFVVAR